ncbi:DUF1108 family protein [Staphylococcus pseudintermedius]|uniref:DUF1108 family protein n=1 Tax=Staphylococcus pseudintermedius TaxID=283734 RepID=UPI001F180153|nr:DUF1108 family protein [Staphylococcus pseudintermedius]
MIEVTDMTYKIIAETKVYDVSDVDIAQEVINAAIYDFIENETDLKNRQNHGHNNLTKAPGEIISSEEKC